MDSVSLCEDPVDFSLFVLKLASKCFGGELGFVFFMCRAAIGIALDGAELIILQTSVLDDITKDNTGLDIGLTLAAVLLMVGALLIIGWQAGAALQDGIDDSEKRRRVNRFFLTFKTVNSTLALIILAGTIYGRDYIVTDKAEQMFLLVSLGLDLLFDPFELILGCYKVHNQ